MIVPIFVLEPPNRYVHPYHGQVVERVLPINEARQICAEMGAPADACAWQSKNRCFVVIPVNGPVADAMRSPIAMVGLIPTEVRPLMASQTSATLTE